MSLKLLMCPINLLKAFLSPPLGQTEDANRGAHDKKNQGRHTSAVIRLSPPPHTEKICHSTVGICSTMGGGASLGHIEGESVPFPGFDCNRWKEGTSMRPITVSSHTWKKIPPNSFALDHSQSSLQSIERLLESKTLNNPAHNQVN